MGQSADEAALLETGDQAVDPGFRLQVEGILHLVERRRDTMVRQMLVNVGQQLMLFAGQHGALSLYMEQN